MSTQIKNTVYAAWAREVLQAHFEKRAPILPLDDEMLNEKAACFVTLHNADGSLRGCIGTILPVHDSLQGEIRENALSAAFHDPRFQPLQPDELDPVVISVDILSKPEPIDDLESLDPKKYGIIVSSGHRRGVLLPDLDGIDTIEQQLFIAMQKAGIPTGMDIDVERFTVHRYH